MIEVEALIVGKGPAGIEAAIYCQRANLKTLVIGKDYGAIEKAQSVDNYYGIESINGIELIERGIAQARNLGIEVLTDEVVGIEFDDAGFMVNTPKESYKTSALLLASGASRNVPRIRKIRNFEGKGVSYCAVCDGFFYRGKSVAVIGAGDYAAHEAEYLASVAAEVTVFADGERISGDFPEYVNVVYDKVFSVVGDDKVTGLVVDDELYEAEGIFVAIGTASTSDLATKLGVEMVHGRIAVNTDMETNIPGLYAAGDCIPGVQQIAKAVGDGCVAGMNMSSYIRHKKRGE